MKFSRSAVDQNAHPRMSRQAVAAAPSAAAAAELPGLVLTTKPSSLFPDPFNRYHFPSSLTRHDRTFERTQRTDARTDARTHAIVIVIEQRSMRYIRRLRGKLKGAGGGNTHHTHRDEAFNQVSNNMHRVLPLKLPCFGFLRFRRFRQLGGRDRTTYPACYSFDILFAFLRFVHFD